MKVVVSIVLLLLPLALSFDFPDKFLRCHLDDPNLDSCLTSAIDAAIHLDGPEGIPSLHLLSLYPIHAKELVMLPRGRLDLKLKYTDITLHGSKEIKVTSAHFDRQAKMLTYTFTLPILKQKSNYDINGKILVLPIYGKGKAIVTLSGVEGTITMTFKEVTRNGELYYKVKSHKMKMTATGAHFDFENLFNGDKLLSDNVLQVVNENSMLIFDDIKEWIEDNYSNVFRDITEKFFDYVPVKYILL